MKRYLILFLLAVILFWQAGPGGATGGQSSELDEARELFDQISSLYDQGHDKEARTLIKPFLIRLDDADKTVNRMYEQGRFQEAVPIASGIIDLRKETLGANHLETAAGLTNLAQLYLKLGEYDRAEPLFVSALEIREKILGPADLDTAQSLDNLATLYRAMEHYLQAEPLYWRALEIRENVLGADHPETAAGLSNLAGLHEVLGEYEEAESLYLKSLDIREKTQGSSHPETVADLNDLAELYRALGACQKAEPLVKRVLEIREKALGPEDLKTAASMNDLAELYRVQGRYQLAEPLYKRALAVRESVLGPEHPDTAAGLCNLGLLYKSRGSYQEAESFYTRALAVRESLLGPDHLETAVTLNNLAELYRVWGDYDRAEPLFKKALDTWERILGPDHPYLSVSLNNLALLYETLGKYDQAERLFIRALTIHENTFGSDHPAVPARYRHLAALYVARLDFDSAFEWYGKAWAATDRLIDLVMGLSSEDRKMRFLSTGQREAEMLLSLVVQHLSDRPDARRAALDLWLRRKGILLEAWKSLQDVSGCSEDPEEGDMFRKWSRVRRLLAQLTFVGPGKMALKAYREKMVDLQVEKNRLEEELTRLSPDFALQRNIQWAGSRTIAQTLPEDTVLVEFARVGFFNFKTRARDQDGHPLHYLVFILSAGEEGRVELIDLGEAADIDRTIELFKKEIKKGEDGTIPAQRLFNQVFAEVKTRLGEVRNVFISPDGNLNLVPFEVFQDPDGRFLIEDYTFNYLAAGRDYMGFDREYRLAGPPVLVGDPTFDLSPEKLREVTKALVLEPADHVPPGRRSRDLQGPFAGIPQTGKEIVAIRNILNNPGTQSYTGPAALEDVVLAAEAPGMLHLATRGFFLSDQDDGEWAGSEPSHRALMIGLDEGGTRPGTGWTGKGIENPWCRSGLALTGANNVFKTTDLTQSQGILTAEKILRMKLEGTDMVVLSTCDTGLGDSQAGEGVYGLRRAFVRAGTRGLIMSMWPIPEKENLELLVTFYQNLIQKRIPRRQALQKAILEEMKVVKERYGHTPPLFWGAYLHLGEP